MHSQTSSCNVSMQEENKVKNCRNYNIARRPSPVVARAHVFEAIKDSRQLFVKYDYHIFI